MTNQELITVILQLKEQEHDITSKRRAAEDLLLAQIEYVTKEGTTTIVDGDTTIKVVSRYNEKVDAKVVQEIAAERGLDHLSLFRWKCEINRSRWTKELDAVFASAIKREYGRPQIQFKEEA